MKKLILAGATDQTLDIFVQASNVTTGAGLTGLVFNTASLVCYYRKGATGSATALTLATQTVGGAHSDGGFVEIDATNMPGMYRLDLSDTIVATAGSVSLMLKGAANMAPVTIELQVGSTNFEGGVVPTVTTATNVTTVNGLAANVITASSIAADAITAAKIATGAIDADAIADNAIDAGAIATGAITAAKFAAGAIDAAAIADNAIDAGAIAAAALNGKGDWNVGKTGYSLTATTGLGNQTADITGNLSGSVGSVTAITASGGIVSADIKKVNNVTVNGDGSGTPWGP